MIEVGNHTTLTLTATGSKFPNADCEVGSLREAAQNPLIHAESLHSMQEKLRSCSFLSFQAANS